MSSADQDAVCGLPFVPGQEFAARKSQLPLDLSAIVAGQVSFMFARFCRFRAVWLDYSKNQERNRQGEQ